MNIRKLALCCLTAGSLAIGRPYPTVTSHSFFSVQPLLYQEGSPILVSLFEGYINSCGLSRGHGAFQAVVFGSSSVHWDKDVNLATYFFPFNKTCLVAGEFGSEAVQNNSADLIANYFGVETADPADGVPANHFNFTNGTFQSNISIRPKQTVVGVGLQLHQKLTNPEGPRGFWLSFNMPIVRVHNNVRFCEKIIDPGAGDVQPGFVGTIGDALRGGTVFGNKHFEFGRIPVNNCGLSKAGVGDIEIKLGFTSICHDTCHLASYGGLILPTSNKPKGVYIFEPIFGNNKHFGILLGTKYGFKIWEREAREWAIWIEGIVNSRYLLSNKQRRSVDLVDKQWSRYIWLYPNEDAVPLEDITPGINLLTPCLKVHPRFQFNKIVSWIFTSHNWIGEGGYTLNMRQAERICLACKWEEGPGIVGIDGNDTTVLHTKSNASIRNYGITAAQFINVDVDPNFVPIKEEDLNISSAAHPCSLSQTVFVALGYKFEDREHEPFAGVGASYEFSSENTSIQRVSGWVKGGLNW